MLLVGCVNKAFLGLDYGRERIGLAVSENGIIARPLRTILNKGLRKNLVPLSEIVKQFNVNCIVIGLPVHKDMTMADEVRGFAVALGELGVEIAFQNEMMSSMLAEEEIRGRMGITDRKKIAQLIDSVAACMILNEYLKENNNNGLQNW